MFLGYQVPKDIFLMQRTMMNVMQESCQEYSPNFPKRGKGVKTVKYQCDRAVVRDLDFALINDKSIIMRNIKKRSSWPITHFLPTDCHHSSNYRQNSEKTDRQTCASAAYILVWADRWKVQFSAILFDNWTNFKIESVCQHYELLNVTFWFMIISLVLDLLAEFCQISEKNLNFWHSY